MSRKVVSVDDLRMRRLVKEVGMEMLRVHRLPRRWWRSVTIKGGTARELYLYRQSYERYKKRPDAITAPLVTGVIGRYAGFSFVSSLEG